MGETVERSPLESQGESSLLENLTVRPDKYTLVRNTVQCLGTLYRVQYIGNQTRILQIMILITVKE